MQDLETTIADYLRQCQELIHLTGQGGRMELDSISFEIHSQQFRSVIIAVRFTEIVMEGLGLAADRIDRFGYLRLELNEFGEVVQATVL